MKHFMHYFFCLAFVASACVIKGQNSMELFHQISKQNGLSQVSVFAIAQDSAGFMWFGTRNGLNKFDGYRVKVYSSSATNKLLSNDIRNLYVDPVTKDIWIGSFIGLNRYVISEDRFVPYAYSKNDTTSLNNNIINQVFRDSRGRLWVATSLGLNLYHADTEDFSRIYLDRNHRNGSQALNPETIFEDSAGNLLIGTDNGLFKLMEKDDSTFTFERIDDLILSEDNIKCIAEDSKGNLWIGTENEGLNYWDRSKDTTLIYQSDIQNPFSLSHNSIRTLCRDNADNLWVGTFDGLNYLEAEKSDFKIFKKNTPQQNSLSDKSIHSLLIDKKESLWVGTYYGGVNHLDNDHIVFKNFKHDPNKNSLSADVVSSFVEDTKQNLWIGTEGGGLNYFDKQKNEFSQYPFKGNVEKTIQSNSIKKLVLDNDSLWIGTFRDGLALYDTNKESYQYFINDPTDDNSLSNNNVYNLYKDQNKLWILTYGNGLDILDLEENKFYHYPPQINNENSINSGLTRTILKTKTDEFWIGTDDGLNQVLLDNNGLPERFIHYLPGEKIYSLQKNGDKSIWVGTFTNGLFQINLLTKEIAHITTEDGLAGNSIFGIIEVSESELWLSTNNGITKLNQRDRTSSNYDLSNGIANLEHNFNAYFKTSTGDILFGGIDGFTQFHPEEIVTNDFIPPIVFTGISQNNKELRVQDENGLSQDINLTEEIRLKYNEANISIGFAALDYFSPENNRYAYMLEGLDKEWNYTTGKTDATYVIQREGKYTFKLKGANSDGVWNPTERRLIVTVLPPPYRTWWAYLLYGIVCIAGIYALLRFIRLRHSLQLEQLANQKKEELHEMKLRFFTNITHEFRTPLTLIIGPLKDLLSNVENPSSDLKKRVNFIENNVQRLLNLVNQLMTFRKLSSDHEPLELAELNIVAFVHDVFKTFELLADRKNIDYQYQSEIGSSMIWFDTNKIEKVCSNLIFNAFKFTPDEGKIIVAIKNKPKAIEIIVKDNGPGVNAELQDQIFNRFYEKTLYQSSTIKGTGIGLAISKQIIELHGGTLQVKNSDSETSGATFIVKLHKGDSHFKPEVMRKKPVKSSYILEEKVRDIKAIEKVEIQNTVIDKSDNAELPLLLIVEDNSEISAYVQQIFQGVYRFATAENGKIGIEKARAEFPDMIISDIMMPVMDGIEFCSTLKNDVELSHIPVILLTARIESIYKIEGLKTGADDYVTKPFNPDELRLRVRNITKSRQKIKDRFARSLNFDPKEIDVTSADETFLINAMNVVEENIENTNFKVVQFAYELAVSRSLLFSKLKALTGQTPNNFIKTVRLKRAAQLLQKKKLNVSEIAYKVGFKDPKYFRKCFKDQFNVNPSEFMHESIET